MLEVAGEEVETLLIDQRFPPLCLDPDGMGCPPETFRKPLRGMCRVSPIEGFMRVGERRLGDRPCSLWTFWSGIPFN